MINDQLRLLERLETDAIGGDPSAGVGQDLLVQIWPTDRLSGWNVPLALFTFPGDLYVHQVWPLVDGDLEPDPGDQLPGLSEAVGSRSRSVIPFEESMEG